MSTEFRSMRRGAQELTREECEEILYRGKTGILTVNGDAGYPYPVPINYVYYQGKIYLHCAKSGHKSDAVRKDNKVGFCVIAEDEVLPEEFATSYRSVVLFGRARILETEEEIIAAARVLGLKYNPDVNRVMKEIAAEMKRLSCMEIRVEHMTGKESLDRMRKRTHEGQS